MNYHYPADLFKKTAVVTALSLFMLIQSCQRETELDGLVIVNTSELKNKSNSSVTCGGNILINNGTYIRAKGVVWSTHENPTLDDNKTVDGSGDKSFESHITGLSNWTKYYIRAYITNEFGTLYGYTRTYQTFADEFTDERDGRVYPLVRMNDECWMAENLRYLPEVMGPATGSWTLPCYYVYGYNGTDVNQAKATENYQTYGVLYNWQAAFSACPQGWHLPWDDEWQELEIALGVPIGEAGMWGLRGTDQGSQLAGRADLWLDGMLEYNAAFGTSGFNALPAGYRSYNCTFNSIGRYCIFWSIGFGTGSEYFRDLYYNRSTIYRNINLKDLGFCVRCIKDK